MSNKEIYLIRHLATNFNKTGVFMGRSFDLPIDEEGVEDFLRNLRTSPLKLQEDTALYSSPALRCLQTIKLLKDEKGIDSKITQDGDFSEVDYGDFEGKDAKQIRELFPRELDILMEKPSEVAFPSGESLSMVQDRAWRGLNKLIDEHEGEVSMVICTHVDIIKLLIFKVMQTSIDMKRYLHIHNGSISCLEVTPERVIKVKFLNRL